METTSPVPHASTLNSEKAKVLAAWALARTTPFTIDDVELCLGLKLDLPRQGRSQVESFLAAHPSIVSLEELFFTPRILAMARSFRIRLLPEEHTGQFLVPGHRFLPFVPLDTPPDRIRVVNAQLVALPRRTVPVSAGLLRMAHAFLGTTEFCRLPPEQQVPASVFDLSGVPRGPKEQLAEDWLVTCHDFDALTFFLTPLTNTRAATATKKLNQGLRFAVRGRWRGPRTAPRQLLAAVACCWPEPRSTPIGPIGPALNNHRHVILAGPDGHPVLMEAPAGKAVAETEAPRKVVPDTPGEPPPEEMLRRLHHTLGDLSVRAQPQTAPFRGRFQKWQWDSQYENYFTVLRDPFSELEFDIHIDAEFNAITGVLNGFCSCTDADEDMAEHGGSCIHVLAAFIDLQASLSAARAVAPPEPPAPWRTLIDALDELSAQPAAQDQRLVWRLRLDTHDVELTAYEQKRLKSGGWSAGRQINLYRLQYLRDAWISAEDRQVAKLLEHRRVAGVLSAPGHNSV